MSEPLILVIEDEKDIRDLIVFTLQTNDFQVIDAVNGQDGIQKATEIKPDLILMDVRMPKMSGFEACRILKRQKSTKAIPIVFLSAKGQEADIDAGLALGAAGYLLKPFDLDEPPRRIRQILNNSLTGGP
jgi:DNA-binding response OmpR family regulator